MDGRLDLAASVSGAKTDTDTVRLGLEALVRREAYERLRALRGSEPRTRRSTATGTGLGSQALHGMIVLVDTSVWIRFLSNRAPYAAELDGLLSRDEVSGHDFVYGELLIGDKGGRKRLLADYGQIHRAPLVPHDEVVAFVSERRLHGRGVGWIGVHLLASALVGHLKLWTTDPRLVTLANELGVAYD
jgi:predicted nucleic acid-binding protein